MIRFRNNKGFTLVEIIFALFVGVLLMSAVYFTMISGQRSATGVERKVAAQQDVRGALEIMALEISMASYNPNFMSGIWLMGPTAVNPSDRCVTPVGTTEQAYKGIQEATPTSITVEMDIGENGSIGSPNDNEIIRYVYDAANEYITRSITCGGNQPFLGDSVAAAAGTRTVRVVNNTLGINNGAGVPAIFRYYDARNPATELYPGTNPGQIPDIRRIDITLAVETEEIDPSTGNRRQMIYSTSVLVRNHAIN